MSRASPPDVPHVLQYWLGLPRMMGLGAPIGPKFRDGAIWGAKPSPFGATRWTRGDVYERPDLADTRLHLQRKRLKDKSVDEGLSTRTSAGLHVSERSAVQTMILVQVVAMMTGRSRKTTR